MRSIRMLLASLVLLSLVVACSAEVAVRADETAATTTAAVSPTATEQADIAESATPSADESEPPSADINEDVESNEIAACIEQTEGRTAVAAVTIASTCLNDAISDNQKTCAVLTFFDLGGGEVPDPEPREDSDLHGITILPAFGEVIPLETLELVSGLEGVLSASPGFFDFEPIVTDGQGRPLVSDPPIFGGDWESISVGTSLVEGRAPAAPGEMALSAAAVALGDFQVGGEYEVNASGPGGGFGSFELVGVFSFEPQVEGFAVLLSAEESLQFFNGGAGYDAIRFQTASDPEVLVASVQAELDAVSPGLKVQSEAAFEAELAEEQRVPRDIVTYGIAAVTCLEPPSRITFVANLVSAEVDLEQADCLLAYLSAEELLEDGDELSDGATEACNL